MFDEQSFQERLKAGTLTVGVVGLGYVGLPLSLTFVERTRLRVLGFDINPSRVQALTEGRSYLAHLASERVQAANGTGRFLALSEFSRLAEADVVVIAVPTPLTPANKPDLLPLLDATCSVLRALRPGQLIVVESSTYPGTTDEVLLPLLESGNLRHDSDFLLAYSPEREDPGNVDYGTANIPKLVGGVSPLATRLGRAFYELAIAQVVPVSSARVAEAAKMTENVFRAVNIALVNELKQAYSKMGLDIWEVLDAAATKPFGFMRFNPGPGLGGHCIPIDPVYLSWAARQRGAETRLIDVATEVARETSQHVVDRLLIALRQRGIAIESSPILLLGVAYKKNIGDPRESPALTLIKLCSEERLEVSYHDPFVPELSPRRSQPLTEEFVRSQAAVVLVTDHDGIDYAWVQQHARLIIDTRGRYREPLPNVVRA